MKTIAGLVFCLLLSPIASVASTSSSLLYGHLAGLAFGDSYQTSQDKLTGRCESTTKVPVDPPSFPLARDHEAHLICRPFQHGAFELGTVALTFADDALVLFYAEGNATALLDLLKEPPGDYLHFTASFKDLLVVDKAADRAWVMAPEAAHINIFQWANPYTDPGHDVSYAGDADRPVQLQFGNRLEDLKAGFKEACDFTFLGTYDVWLLNEPEVQQQLDCFGIEFAGFPRKIEAVFGDGILEQAWILTGQGEEDRLRQALIAAFGEPIYVDEQWEIFDDNRVMLRKDKPEVLMLSDQLAPLYREREIDAR